MSSSRDRRVIKELQDLTEDKDNSGIHASPVNESLTHLQGWFHGPGDTPYAGGKYYIRIMLDGQYPFKPPQMQFETKIWHPNVSSQTVRRLIHGFTASSAQTPPLLSLWCVVWRGRAE
jgi:ubiquitin-conjugating enzyme (huntingtin interacting protein 2)